MSNARAEAAVKKLARLPGNTVCANCGTEKKFGFSTVCIKYRTFVCNMCKSSHQAISHRCKSLTMSTWTDAEVTSLTEQGGGGNDVARRTWLANAPPVGSGGRPKQGDDLDVFKRFVVDVYERRRYWGDAPAAAAESDPPAAPSPAPSRAPAPARKQNFATFPPAPAPAPTPAPAPAPASNVDLLDFASFGNGVTSGNEIKTPAAAPCVSSFSADFDAFASAPSSAPSAPTQVPSNGGQSGFGFIQQEQQQSGEAMGGQATSTKVMKKPVMNNFNPAMRMNGSGQMNMGMGVGMNMNINMNMQQQHQQPQMQQMMMNNQGNNTMMGGSQPMMMSGAMNGGGSGGMNFGGGNVSNISQMTNSNMNAGQSVMQQHDPFASINTGIKGGGTAQTMNKMGSSGMGMANWHMNHNGVTGMMNGGNAGMMNGGMEIAGVMNGMGSGGMGMMNSNAMGNNNSMGMTMSPGAGAGVMNSGGMFSNISQMTAASMSGNQSNGQKKNDPFASIFQN